MLYDDTDAILIWDALPLEFDECEPEARAA